MMIVLVSLSSVFLFLFFPSKQAPGFNTGKILHYRIFLVLMVSKIICHRDNLNYGKMWHKLIIHEDFPIVNNENNGIMNVMA